MLTSTQSSFHYRHHCRCRCHRRCCCCCNDVWYTLVIVNETNAYTYTLFIFDWNKKHSKSQKDLLNEITNIMFTSNVERNSGIVPSIRQISLERSPIWFVVVLLLSITGYTNTYSHTWNNWSLIVFNELIRQYRFSKLKLIDWLIIIIIIIFDTRFHSIYLYSNSKPISSFAFKWRKWMKIEDEKKK